MVNSTLQYGPISPSSSTSSSSSLFRLLRNGWAGIGLLLVLVIVQTVVIILDRVELLQQHSNQQQQVGGTTWTTPPWLLSWNSPSSSMASCSEMPSSLENSASTSSSSGGLRSPPALIGNNVDPSSPPLTGSAAPTTNTSVVSAVARPESSTETITTNLSPTVFEGVVARAFDPWNQTSLPCVPAEDNWYTKQKDPTDEGLIFLKAFKTGSSTASGVNLRMARNIAKRQTPPISFDMCKARSDHAWASGPYGNRNPAKSFLWTILREPDSRIVSQFFHFAVSRNRQEPSDINFASYLKSGPQDMMHDYYVGALSLQPYEKHRDDPVDTMNAILKCYNFIGVTERMDESFVALSMVLGVPLADVMYLTAKGHGGFDDGGRMSESKMNVCTYIWPSFVSEGMQALLDSDDWQTKSHWDRVLYQAVNRSLDLTIDRLGRSRFDQRLRLYRQALDRGREVCLHKTRFPCSSGGVYTKREYTDCLWKDSGCGCDCLDEVADELHLWDVP